MLAKARAPSFEPDEDVEIASARAGEEIVRVRLHGRRDGPLVIAAGGISADRHVRAWWGDIAAEGGAIDLATYCVLGFDFAPLADRRAPLTPHLQAELLLDALDGLGVSQAHAFVGASYGAMVGLALAELAPARLGAPCCDFRRASARALGQRLARRAAAHRGRWARARRWRGRSRAGAAAGDDHLSQRQGI
ncbi:MAG: hypothetical protein NVV62_12955 [Terricaulis sp.]|nr:hypothetical protein [Terricaulis sp.]